MQLQAFFHWLLGPDRIGWAKTALLSGLIGMVIAYLLDPTVFDATRSTGEYPNKWYFILLGYPIQFLLRRWYQDRYMQVSAARPVAAKPNIPSVDDSDGVIEWFINHDDKLADVRRYGLNQWVYKDVASDLATHGSSKDSLIKHLKSLSEFYALVLEQLALRKDGPLDGETPDKVAELHCLEIMCAAKMRILGYFLLRKYGVNPTDVT